MKFGKQIQGQALSEWSLHYMNYKALKKVINSINYPLAPGDSVTTTNTLTASPPTLSLSSSLSTSTSTSDPPQLQALKATFFFKLERELDRVNAFYLTKEADVKLRLRTLLEKKRLVRESSDNPATLRSIQEALWNVQQELTKLQQYVELNATGFRKILKKWDKRSKSSTKELYLARQVEIQPCFNRDTLTELTDIIAHHLAELSQLNIHVASPSSQPSQPSTTSLGLSTTAVTASASASASSSPVSATLRPVPSPLDDLDADLAQAAKSGDTHRLVSLIQSVPSASTAHLVVARLIQRIARSAATTASTSSSTSASALAQDASGSGPSPSPPTAIANAKLDTQIAAIQTLLEMYPQAVLVTDDINHRSAIHFAAISRLPQLVAIVLSALASSAPAPAPASSSSPSAHKETPLDARDMYGRTPLHYAAMHADMLCASKLVGAGARAGLVDHDGCTSLVYAVVAGHVALVELLLGATAMDPLQDAHLVALAARYGHLEVGKMLMHRGIKVECDDAGLHPLHITAKQGHLEFTKVLCLHVLASTSSIDISDKYYNWTPLFYAASEGHVKCCQVLLDHGARPDLVDETGWTAMTHAVYRGHVDVANLLNERVTALAAKAAAASPAAVAQEEDEDVDMIGNNNNNNNKEIQPIAPSRLFVAPTPPAPAHDDDGVGQGDSMDLDAIPSLALPPPILPFRIYGHMYLESKYQIQVSFPSALPISLYAQNLASLRIVLAAKPDQGGSIPHTIILPLDGASAGTDDAASAAAAAPADMYSFQVASLADSALHFDVFPVYGTRPIARGVVLARELARGNEHGQWHVPLFDGLALVGEMAVRFAIVRPFAHPRLAVGGAVATYWKTTQVLTGGAGAHVQKASSLVGTPNAGLAPMPMPAASALMASPVLPSSSSSTAAAAVSAVVPGSSASANTSSTIASLITASSLAHKYVHVPVYFSRDGVAVVSPHPVVDVPMIGATGGLTIPVPIAQLSVEQFKQIGHALGQGWTPGQLPLHPSATQLAAAVRRSHFTLRECLETIPKDVGVVIEVMHQDPLAADGAAAGAAGWHVNQFVDSVLKDVYDCATTTSAGTPGTSRPVIFCSLSRAVCNAINWKQPNYAVFFSTYAGYAPPGGQVAASGSGSSLKEAIRFAKANNMLGILVYAQPLVQVPALVPAVKEAGLLCATFGEDVNGDPKWVVEQERAGVDGVFSAGVLRFTTSASEGM
ncbi:hypothetical protein BCR44DRAFT_33919 [Catenaria anguillulae PL171]|uniref:SPX domain-domain-containing protein n=1 Tax=Catenaria anguillulae PL171 TaxID=765915 RepID=A0A1Y2HNB1_9FUNG|nr:hypothetical protein BCR44DRAFT_33919 [Catenaria anguillulae PL171]